MPKIRIEDYEFIEEIDSHEPESEEKEQRLYRKKERALKQSLKAQRDRKRWPRDDE